MNWRDWRRSIENTRLRSVEQFSCVSLAQLAENFCARSMLRNFQSGGKGVFRANCGYLEAFLRDFFALCMLERRLGGSAGVEPPCPSEIFLTESF